jgi:hypothetical protein
MLSAVCLGFCTMVGYKRNHSERQEPAKVGAVATLAGKRPKLVGRVVCPRDRSDVPIPSPPRGSWGGHRSVPFWPRECPKSRTLFGLVLVVPAK